MMDVFTFLYYMIYTLFTKIGNIAYKTSPITIDVNDRNALERVGILVNNGTGAMFIFWLLLLDLDFYLWMPHIGLGQIRAYLLGVVNVDTIIICLLAIEALFFYFLIFYKDKYIKKFERFRKMGCFLTFIYSVIGLTLLLLPIILLFAAI